MTTETDLWYLITNMTVLITMKVPDKFKRQNMVSQNPKPLFWAVALSVHQVLEP